MRWGCSAGGSDGQEWLRCRRIRSPAGPLIRLALTEAAVFGLTFGVAVALGRTPPPPPRVVNPSIPAVEIGYDLAGPPTVARVLFDWRFDLVFGTAAIVFAAVYLAGVRRLRRRGDTWPTGRLVAWLLRQRSPARLAAAATCLALTALRSARPQTVTLLAVAAAAMTLVAFESRPSGTDASLADRQS